MGLLDAVSFCLCEGVRRLRNDRFKSLLNSNSLRESRASSAAAARVAHGRKDRKIISFRSGSSEANLNFEGKMKGNKIPRIRVCGRKT